jgi:flagellin-specific chaperone FliS
MSHASHINARSNLIIKCHDGIVACLHLVSRSFNPPVDSKEIAQARKTLDTVAMILKGIEKGMPTKGAGKKLRDFYHGAASMLVLARKYKEAYKVDYVCQMLEQVHKAMNEDPMAIPQFTIGSRVIRIE